MLRNAQERVGEFAQLGQQRGISPLITELEEWLKSRREFFWSKGLTIKLWGYTLVNALKGRLGEPSAPNLEKSIV